MAYKQKWANDENLNEVEHIKLKKDGLDVIKTIVDKYGKEGYSSISASDLGLFKWAGVYEQKPKDGYFMLRVRITTSILNVEQIRVLAQIARDFGRGVANITTRGAIQFHWITVENLPIIFERLKSVGLCSFEACGDCPRTVIGNALAGIDKDEIIDTTKLANELNDFFLLNRDFSNLPRKFKLSISGSVKNSGNAQINDLAFTPSIKVIDGREVVGFSAWVGGGLSSMPMLAQKLDVFIKPEEVVKFAEAVCTVFRDNGYREKRTRARLKFLVADWGIEKFTKEVLLIMSDVEKSGEEQISSWNGAYFYGINEQKQSGKYYIGMNVPLGEINSEELEELADIAENFGDGEIRTTLTQNIVLSGLSIDNAKDIIKRNIFDRLKIDGSNGISYTISCTGNQYCNLAVVETKERAKDVMRYIDSKNILKTPVRVHFTGCPNACGQKQIADIAFQGAIIKENEESFEAFSLWIGGTLEGNGDYAKSLNIKVKADEIKYLLEKIILFFNENRIETENFYHFSKRVGLEMFNELLIEYK